MLPLLLSLLLGTASAAEAPPAATPLVLVGAPQRTLALELDERIREDLRQGRWEAAANGLERMDRDALDEVVAAL